jgi:hypothetical protein
MWTEVSSSVPHFLQVGLLLSPIIYKCLLNVLCPGSRPTTTLDCVLLKGNNRALLVTSVSEVHSRSCLCLLQWSRHNTRCWFSIQRYRFLLIFWLETSEDGLGREWHMQPTRMLMIIYVVFWRNKSVDFILRNQAQWDNFY